MRWVPLLVATVILAGCATTHLITPSVEASATAFSDAQAVDVTLANFDFTPPTIHLRAGQAYRLQLHNAAMGGHDFTAPEFFASARVAAADAAKVAQGKVELTAGKSETVRLVPAAGRYKLVCSHLGHAVLGMTGQIVVD